MAASDECRNVLDKFTTERIKRDIHSVAVAEPEGIMICTDEKEETRLHVIMEGPIETPYSGGFFHIVVDFTDWYPFQPPRVTLVSTGRHTVRFNLNFLANGQVVHKILNTEEPFGWSSNLSLRVVLLSLKEKLFYDPFQDNQYNCVRKAPDMYRDMLIHETLRIAVIGTMNQSEIIKLPKKLLKRLQLQFVSNYKSYEQIAVSRLNKNGLRMMPSNFEHNAMNLDSKEKEYIAKVMFLNHCYSNDPDPNVQPGCAAAFTMKSFFPLTFDDREPCKTFNYTDIVQELSSIKEHICCLVALHEDNHKSWWTLGRVLKRKANGYFDDILDEKKHKMA